MPRGGGVGAGGGPIPSGPAGYPQPGVPVATGTPAVEEPQFLSLSSIVTRLVLKVGEYSLVNVPSRTLYERQIAAAASAARMGGPGRTLDEQVQAKDENVVNTLLNYYKEEGAVRIIGATSLAFTNDLFYGVIASISYVFCRMVPVLLGMTSGEDVDWQSSSFMSLITSHSIASAVTYPLFLASYQVRHHAWTGFSGLLPSGENFYGKLRDNVVAHLAEMVTLHTIRPAIVDTLYVLFGEWLLAKADGETLADQAAYHVGIRGVHFMGSLFVGLIHLPVSTIVTKLRAHPDAYDSLWDCIKKTWKTQGLKGFYGSAFWYLLANNQLIMP